MSIEILKQNIVEVQDCDVLVNAANGIGVMGRGVAGAISFAAGGQEFVNEFVRPVAMEKGGYNAGEIYVTDCGKLNKKGFKKIYHAVTMKFPGGFTSYDIVEKCLNNVFQRMLSDKYNSVAIPSLGTGIGGLNVLTVSNIFVKICQKYKNKFEIKIVDINEEFIKLMKEQVKEKETLKPDF